VKNKLSRAIALAVHAALLLTLFSGSAAAVPAKIALIHSNPVLGDDDANVVELESLVAEAFQHGADIVVTPELATTGFSITRAQVIADLGFTSPYPELDDIRDLAIQNQGYVFIAIAEVTPAQAVYNTVVVFGPNGLLTTRQKRGLSGWHDRGIIPFDVIHTVYGDLATLICSDSYLPEWIRIATLEGADIVLLPANWWGRGGQEEIWQTRARENGVWFLTANRWGTEVDERFGFPFTYYMDDAPSAAITPDGEIQLIYRTEEDPAGPSNKVLYYTVDVPHYRIGTELNPTYTVNFREPEAYGAIANLYYRPDLGNQPAPGLPPTGVTLAGSISYKPNLLAPALNLAKIQSLWDASNETAQVLVLPGRGITSVPVDTSNPSWYTSAPWTTLQSFVQNEGLLLLVTTIIENDGSGHLRESLLLVRPGQAPLLRGQIHDSIGLDGSGQAPLLLDLPNARVAVLTGRDALFPETNLAAAKSGADLVLISSAAGAEVTSHDVNAPHYFWEPPALLREWKTRTNEVVHLAAADWTGNGAVIENMFGGINRLEETNAATPVQVLDLDSSFVRTKFLNAYYPFDLDVLLSD
jgi:predicted amidohydrolase